jgi:hypothetical protein
LPIQPDRQDARVALTGSEDKIAGAVEDQVTWSGSGRETQLVDAPQFQGRPVQAITRHRVLAKVRGQ